VTINPITLPGNATLRLSNLERVCRGRAHRQPCQIGLHVDATQRIFVTGNVIELGRGSIHL